MKKRIHHQIGGSDRLCHQQDSRTRFFALRTAFLERRHLSHQIFDIPNGVVVRLLRNDVEEMGLFKTHEFEPLQKESVIPKHMEFGSHGIFEKFTPHSPPLPPPAFLRAAAASGDQPSPPSDLVHDASNEPFNVPPGVCRRWHRIPQGDNTTRYRLAWTLGVASNQDIANWAIVPCVPPPVQSEPSSSCMDYAFIIETDIALL